jgi:hypothetical protein
MLRSQFPSICQLHLPLSDSPASSSKVYNMGMFCCAGLRSPSSSRRFAIVGLFLVALCAATLASAQDTSHRGRKYKAPPATSHFEVTVLRATSGKPVENAAVIFHPLQDGRNAGNMELKTNDEGKCVIDLLAIGSDVRVQIIAPGFQTYGEDYKVDKDTMAIEIKLKRPTAQYSIYNKNEGGKASKDKPADSPDAAPKDAAPDAPKDAAPKDAQPDTDSGAKADAPKDESKPQDAQPK